MADPGSYDGIKASVLSQLGVAADTWNGLKAGLRPLQTINGGMFIQVMNDLIADSDIVAADPDTGGMTYYEIPAP